MANLSKEYTETFITKPNLIIFQEEKTFLEAYGIFSIIFFFFFTSAIGVVHNASCLYSK